MYAADDMLLGRGQSVGVGIAVQNESSKRLASVEAKITERVVWRAGGHSNSSHRTIAQTAWDMGAVAGLEEGLAALQLALGISVRRVWNAAALADLLVQYALALRSAGRSCET